MACFIIEGQLDSIIQPRRAGHSMRELGLCGGKGRGIQKDQTGGMGGGGGPHCLQPWKFKGPRQPGASRPHTFNKSSQFSGLGR